MLEKTTTWHLRLDKLGDYRAYSGLSKNVSVKPVHRPTPELNHFFFMTIGRPYRWFSRLGWDYQQWHKFLSQQQVQTWIGYQDEIPFGYFELVKHDEDVEILFFGVLPGFVGQGLGGYLLNQAIEKAWSLGTDCVWLHTCSNDHPAALGNYQSRGFNVFKVEEHEEDIPDANSPLWGTPKFYASLPK